ncbi:MAG: flagellar hook-basal body complex protein [Candidimonas sp.]|nr:MAG: flagellar hook-basal body complex protein [Candidimonas sp.]
MDRIVYTAAGGAARTLEAQAALANNLANADTTGFRAQLAAYRAVPVNVPDAPQPGTRVLTATTTGASLMAHGAIHTTGRVLDVAVQGDGWIAVQTPQGEAYTRAGSLQMNPSGELVTSQGWPVLSRGGGPIVIPPRAHIHISRHGGVNSIAPGETVRDIARLGNIKLVNPDPRTLVRGDDGLFRIPGPNGGFVAAPTDPRVQIKDRALEGSNVSPTAQMVGLIQNARSFQMQMSVIKQASANAQSANAILGPAGN